MPKKNICVLEDNDGIREIIELILEDEAYEVESYATVEAFKSRPATDTPAMFVLDVMLPDGNGLEVCNELKADESTNAVPILIMSAHSTLSTMQKSCRAEDFIAKPFDIYDFVDRIDRYAKT